MKLLGPLHGFVAFKEFPEEYQPETPAPLTDVVNSIRSTYQFTVYPIFNPAGIPETFTFANGRFLDGDKTFAIGQLVMAPNADIAVTISTEQAERVLEHLMDLLDTNFGYRLRQAKIVKSFLSNIVVTFDRGLEEYIRQFEHMADIINRFRLPERREFAIKRLAFGDSPEPVTGVDIMAMIERGDFTIERRAGRPFGENRYFSSAPLRTQDHIRVLEQIEAVAKG